MAFTSHTISEQAERVLADATSFLVERARKELERAVAQSGTADQEHVEELQRARHLEAELAALRRHHSTWEPAGASRQVSRYYEVPGQEDT